ncbi:hypothetical protein GCM10010519_52850 [Streptomyces lactacystinicus]
MEQDQDVRGPVQARATGAVEPPGAERPVPEPPPDGGQSAPDPGYGGAWTDPPGHLEPASAPVAPACGCGGPGAGAAEGPQAEAFGSAPDQPAFVWQAGAGAPPRWWSWSRRPFPGGRR